MKKIAVIDLMFRWPPDGGARVDLKEVLTLLSDLYQVKLFVPEFQGRGVIDGHMEFAIETIPFTQSTFKGPHLVEVFREKLTAFDPDLVIVADGFQLRPWLAEVVGAYPYLVRFYAYENLCNRDNGVFLRELRPCYRTGLKASVIDKIYCNLCAAKYLVQCIRIGARQMVAEFTGASTWSLAQWQRVKTLLDGASDCIVYNGFLQEFLALKGYHSTVIPGGFNPDNFKKTARRKPDGTLRIGFSGRSNDMRKGAVTAIRAMLKLRQRGINAELHITGEHQSGFPLLPGVNYQGWFTSDTMHRFYENVDIIVVPSVWQEPFGIVTLEAMACGRPVVASRVAGQREIIRHGENGYLAAPQSACDFADQIEACWRSEALTEKIIDTAWSEVHENYTWKTIVERDYLPLISSVIGC